MKRIINYLAVLTIPPSLTINITRLLEYKDFISFVFTVSISIIALLTGIIAYKHYKIKKEMAQIELDQKKEELKQKKEDREKKEKEPTSGTGFFKNNIIK